MDFEKLVLIYIILFTMLATGFAAAYLHDVCERTRQEAAEKLEEAAQNNELMLFLMAGCALAAGGAVTIQTENMSRVLEEKRVLFHADFEKHLATVSVVDEDGSG